jgi:hypothetical protein
MVLTAEGDALYRSIFCQGKRSADCGQSLSLICQRLIKYLAMSKGNVPCHTFTMGASGLECLIYPILNCGLHIDKVISAGIFISTKWINPGSENGYKN